MVVLHLVNKSKFHSLCIFTMQVPFTSYKLLFHSLPTKLCDHGEYPNFKLGTFSFRSSFSSLLANQSLLVISLL